MMIYYKIPVVLFDMEFTKNHVYDDRVFDTEFLDATFFSMPVYIGANF